MKENTRNQIINLTVALLFILLAAIGLSRAQNTPAELASAPGMTGTPTVTVTPSATPTQNITLVSTKYEYAASPTATLELDPIYIKTLGKGIITDVQRSPDGSIVAVSIGNTLYWYDAETMEELGSRSFNYTVDILNFSPDNKKVVVDVMLGGEIVDLETGAELSGYYEETGFEFSSTSDFVVSRSWAHSTGGPYHSILIDYFYEEHDYVEFPVLNQYNYNMMTDPALSPDDSMIAAGYYETNFNILFIYDRVTGDVIHQIDLPSIPNTVDFSMDGKYVAVGCDDGVVRLYYSETGYLYRTITGLRDSVYFLCFLKDGTGLKIFMDDLSFYVWNLKTAELGELEPYIKIVDPFEINLMEEGYLAGASYGSSLIKFSPNQNQVAVASTHILLFNTVTGEVDLVLQNPIGNNNVIRSLTYNHDGSLIAATTTNGDLFVWYVSTGELFFTYEKNTALGIGVSIGSGVYSFEGIAFSSQNNTLAVGNWDQVLLIDPYQSDIKEGDRNKYRSSCFQRFLFGGWDKIICDLQSQ